MPILCVMGSFSKIKLVFASCNLHCSNMKQKNSHNFCYAVKRGEVNHFAVCIFRVYYTPKGLTFFNIRFVLFILFMSMGWDLVSELRLPAVCCSAPDGIWEWRATVEWYWQEKPEELRGNLSQCHFVRYTSHMDWPGANPGLSGEGPAGYIAVYAENLAKQIIQIMLRYGFLKQSEHTVTTRL
jgi:hypothetical protein